MYHDAFLGKLILQGNSLNSTLRLDCKREMGGRGEGWGGRREGGGGGGEALRTEALPRIRPYRIS